MTQKQWDALELRIDALLDSHAVLREEKRQLSIECDELRERNADMRQRLEAVVERIRRLELESDA